MQRTDWSASSAEIEWMVEDAKCRVCLTQSRECYEASRPCPTHVCVQPPPRGRSLCGVDVGPIAASALAYLDPWFPSAPLLLGSKDGAGWELNVQTCRSR